MKKLWPPLAIIESDLSHPSDTLIARWQAGAPLPTELVAALESDPEAQARREALQKAEESRFEPGDEIPVPPMPADLQALIRQRVAARQARFSPKPTAGQILRIDEIRGPGGLLGRDLPRPLAVLIIVPMAIPQVWYGWLVSSETDYASYWDLLLESEDEPHDPLARMIQLWNPVSVYLPSTSQVLAELKPERLAAVRRLATEYATTPAPRPIAARPGELLIRQVGPYQVRTGTPLGDANDPRRRYQQLYDQAAIALREPAALAATALPPLERIRNVLHAWAATISLKLNPAVPLAQPMGEISAAPTAHYALEDLLHLTLQVDETHRLLHVQLKSRTDTDLHIQLWEQEEVMQNILLQPAAPAVPLTVDLAKPAELLVRHAAGELRFRIPLRHFGV